MPATMNAREPTRPSDAVIKRLFARSGNRCAFPKCAAEIVHGDTIIGEICHIKAASRNGPRYDPQQTAVDRHSYDNLILLCANHHKVIDDDPEAFTVERLTKMKADHKSRSMILTADEIDRGTRLLLEQSVFSINQSGGITAHTVHQTINVHPPRAQADQGAELRSVAARVREFHNNRVNKIATAAAPVALLDGGMLVMHVVPFSAVDERQASSFDEISRSPDMFPPIVDNYARNSKITYDGLLTASNTDGLTKPQRAYVHVFRSGAIEAVASSLGRGADGNFLELPKIQAMIIKYAHIYANSLNAFGLRPPIMVLATLIDVKGKRLLQNFIGNALPEDIPFDVLSRASLQFGEAIFETVPVNYNESAKLLRPILIHLANAAGMSSSPYFDDDGNYTVKFPTSPSYCDADGNYTFTR